MELLGLVGRVVLSLVVVLALLWLAARGLKNNQKRTMRGVEMDVLARQPLAQRASIAVVRLGDRALVLGVTESRVELLSDQPLSDLLAPVVDDTVQDLAPGVIAGDAPAITGPVVGTRTRAAVRASAVSTAQPKGRLAGSALSPQTWSKALDAVRELTVRR